MNKNILYIGPLNKNGTCFQRFIAFKSFFSNVYSIDTFSDRTYFSYLINAFCNKINFWPDILDINKKIKNFDKKIDFVWIDKGLTVKPQSLIDLKKNNTNLKLIHYSPDDMMNKGNQSNQYLNSVPLYDFHITTKSYNVKELYDLNAKNVLFINNCFDQNYHVKITKNKKIYDVGFIGSFEIDRAIMLENLAKSGFKLIIRGNWPNKWVINLRKLGVDIENKEFAFPDYNLFISNCKINLCFLRKVNRDLQTTRSIEIPAMGGFMMAEDTKEHRLLFEENVEAVFFKSFDELKSKIDFYLKNEYLINKIAEAGYNKCYSAGYSNQLAFKKLFKEKINETIS